MDSNEIIRERFWSKVDCGTDDECWLWTGATNWQGYGKCYHNKQGTMAHRVAYLLECGEIKEQHDIHHKCENPSCVNPYHLTQIPHGEHTSKFNPIAITERNRTHCPYGHEYSEENTRIMSNGGRACRTCIKIYDISRTERRRENCRNYYRKNCEKLKADARAYRRRRKLNDEGTR